MRLPGAKKTPGFKPCVFWTFYFSVSLLLELIYNYSIVDVIDK